MIDGQYMGPAALSYRARASDIMDQARRLLSAVDDLDTAARIETQRLQLAESSVDAVALLCRLHDAYERVARAARQPDRRSRSSATCPTPRSSSTPPSGCSPGCSPPPSASPAKARRSPRPWRWARTAAARCSACRSTGRKAIEGLDEQALLDPGYSPDGDWPGAPALGLGFALRLVRNLAEAVGGALQIGAGRFSLYLPPLEPAERSSGRNG